MSDIKIMFVSLRIVLLLVFFISGYFLSKSKTDKQYWKIAVFPIVAFAIISGLRFGRDVDYNIYYHIYSGSIIRNEEFLFSLFVNSFNNLNLPYYSFVLFCSTFFIICFLYLLCKFKNAAFYILPLFLIIGGIENYIRWYPAFGFVLIAVGKLIEKRYLTVACLAIASYFMHEGMIIILFTIAMFYLFTNKKILFTPKISVLLLAVTLFLSSVEYLQSLVSILDYFQFGFLSEKGLYYVEKAGKIASGGLRTGVYEKTGLSEIRWFICYAFPLYFGGKYFEENKLEFPAWLYNLSAFSIIIMPVFTLVELFNRISSALMCFSIIAVGVTIFVANKQRFTNKKTYFYLIVCFMLFLSSIIITSFNRTEDNKMLFIWDAKGRNYIKY